MAKEIQEQPAPIEQSPLEDHPLVRELRQAVLSESERLAHEGRRLLENQDPQRAAELFRQAVEMNPNLIAAHLNLGHALRQIGDFSDASSSYRTAAELVPDDAMTAYLLASTLALAGQLDESIAQYQKSIELNSFVAEAHNGLGEALYARYLISKKRAKKGEVDPKDLLHTIDSFRRAAKLSPNEPLYAENLAAARRVFDSQSIASYK